jgi:hypothetical protein
MKQLICRDCGTIVTKPKTQGSFIMEVLLWCCFIIPGLIYSFWRLTAAKKCSVCNSPRLIPLSSPMGQNVLHTLKTA